MSGSVSKKKTDASATVPATEMPRAEAKKSDVALTIKVILIALAFFGAMWAMEHFISR